MFGMEIVKLIEHGFDPVRHQSGEVSGFGRVFTEVEQPRAKAATKTLKTRQN